jgi:multisubunit Na+/H+ antiporter MnhB subunit
MISGMVMIFIALWFYQSAMKAKVSNVLMWVAIGAVGFFALQWLLVNLNIYILESFRASEGGAGYEAIQGADRKNAGDFLGFSRRLKVALFRAVAFNRRLRRHSISSG